MCSQILFERYLAATVPDDDPEGMLETLLTDHAPPVLNRVVRSRLGSLYTPADAAELSSEAMLELLGRLRALRERQELAGVLPFDGLAAGVAANTVYRFYARRFPERNRLRKRLRYVIATGDRFRLSLRADGVSICGLSRKSPPMPQQPENEQLAGADDVERCVAGMRDRPIPAHPLATLVHEILRRLSRPIDLSRLTAIAADLIGIREPSLVSHSGTSPSPYGEAEEPDLPPDPGPSTLTRLELRQRLENLWREVSLLSSRHRSALLLSARASSGAAVWLVVDLGIASFYEVAAALDLTAEELAGIWNRLPVDDNEIAARLGLGRQQVINLRCTARARLGRRETSIDRGSKVISGAKGQL